MIACRNIDNQSVHFYFGSDKCYDGTWTVSFIVLILLILLFTSFFMKLFVDHRDMDKRKTMKSDEYILSSFVRAYDLENNWYWEMVMFARRLIIAMINVLTDSASAQNILYIIVLIFLFAQINSNPFKIKEVNTLESVCLGCLLITLFILANGSQDGVSVFTLNIVLLLPFIMSLIQFGIINLKTKQKIQIEKELKMESNQKTSTEMEMTSVDGASPVSIVMKRDEIGSGEEYLSMSPMTAIKSTSAESEFEE